MNAGTNKKFYFTTLAVLLLLSAYPLINGARMAWLSTVNGAIEPSQYAKYVVPYTAMCAAAVLFAAALPLLRRLGRFGFPAGLAGAYAVFFPIEIFLENLQIRTEGLQLVSGMQMVSAEGVPATVDIWQAALCIASPLVREESTAFVSYMPTERYYFYVMEGSGYKIHYYFIALLLITMVCGLVYSAARAAGDREAERPVILRGIATAALTALCVFANTTAFFRKTAEVQTPLASVLTALFFVALGCAAGVYLGSFFLKRGRGVGLVLPTALALSAGSLMYFGEAAMMGGGLYRFGTGWFFAQLLSGFALAPVDYLIVLLAGLATWVALAAARRGERWPGRRSAVIAGALCLAVGLSGVGISAAQVRAAAVPVYGRYEYGDCVYMTPLSSQAAMLGGPERFEITEMELIVTYVDDGDTDAWRYAEQYELTETERIATYGDGEDEDVWRYAAQYERTAVPPDAFEDAAMFSPIADLSGYKERWLLAVFTHEDGEEQYGLYSMDDELWLAHITGRAGLWSVYKLKRTP